MRKGGSMICLTAAAATIDEIAAIIENNIDSIDMAEIRADFLDAGEYGGIDKLPSLFQIPLMFTLRRKRDGGQWVDDESGRRRILLHAARAGYRYLDLESDVDFHDVEDECLRTGTRIIRSLHDFNGVPANLSKAVRSLRRKTGDILKAAVMPSSTADLVRIVAASLELSDTEKILIGMGTWGFPTRVLAGKLGSLLSFCSPPKQENAPGHIGPEDLISLYRFRHIAPSTRVFCVAANPVMHSRSPHIHNPGITAVGQDAVYIPVQVDELSSLFELADLLDIRGVSVTLPHKEDVRRFIESEDEVVTAVGSCNTVYPGKDGWKGANTDIPGFIAPLTALVGEEALAKASVTVVGAGGTARTAVYALRRLGARVCIVNRTPEKAAVLAEEFACLSGPLEPESLALIREHSDILVQTSNAGMHPQEDIDPFAFYDFSGNEIVYDVIYTPSETKFLKRARDAGCTVLNGKAMLLEQAYRQFRLFTGEEYPETCKGLDFFS